MNINITPNALKPEAAQDEANALKQSSAARETVAPKKKNPSRAPRDRRRHRRPPHGRPQGL